MKKNSKNTKAFVLTLVAVITLVLAVVGASFAYFTAQTGSGASSNTTVTTKTTDSLTFIGGSPIGITATQDNFGSGKPNLSSETIAKARLIANTGNNTATYNYFVYLDITANDFEYTSATTPELILTITDPSGAEVKTLAGLTYVTSGSVTGFDVTTTKGLIKIAENKEITTTTTKEEDWKVKLTFINLTSDQQKNTGKTFVGQVKIQKESVTPPTFAETLIANNGTIGMDFHTATLANGANDGSYRFSGANPNNYVCFGPGATAAGTACPEENQYRIIGVFGDQVKLIKKTSVGNRQWDNKGDRGDNTWSTSLIKSYLNGEYLNSLTLTWSNKIASNTWQVGGMTGTNGYAVPATAYNYEVGPNKANTTFNGKIGLMYVSDYGFAAQPQAWTLRLGGYNDNTTDYSNPIAKGNNWLFAGADEWTMSRYSDYSIPVFFVYSNGNLYNNDAFNSWAVRPSFNLESFINLNGGNGSAIDPYRI